MPTTRKQPTKAAESPVEPPAPAVRVTAGRYHANLVDVVQGWIHDELDATALDTKVAWAVSFQVFPSPTEDNGWVPTVVLYFEVPGAGEENAFFTTHLLPPFALTKKQVQAAVADNVGLLISKQASLNGSD